MPEYVYRVVSENGAPIGGGERQHCYTRESTARGVATQKNKLVDRYYDGRGRYSIQRAAVEWENLPATTS